MVSSFAQNFCAGEDIVAWPTEHEIYRQNLKCRTLEWSQWEPPPTSHEDCLLDGLCICWSHTIYHCPQPMRSHSKEDINHVPRNSYGLWGHTLCCRIMCHTLPQKDTLLKELLEELYQPSHSAMQEVSQPLGEIIEAENPLGPKFRSPWMVNHPGYVHHIGPFYLLILAFFCCADQTCQMVCYTELSWKLVARNC